MPVENKQPAHRLLDQAEMGAKPGEERGERLDRERRHHERNAKPERIDRPACRRPWRRSLPTPPPPGWRRGSARCRASSQARTQAPSNTRPIARPAWRLRGASRASASAIGVRPRKCSPMTMMTMPATMASSPEYARNTAPMALALAPRATNTVVKPSTNKQRGARASRAGPAARVRHRRSARAKCR